MSGFQIKGSSIPNQSDMTEDDSDIPETPFYLRYYSGLKGRYGHEFLEYDINLLTNSVARLRYTNNSHYRKEALIEKTTAISSTVVEELKRIILDSEILLESSDNWPKKDSSGSEELEICIGKNDRTFITCKITSLADIQKKMDGEDSEGLRVFYYLVQDLKALIFALIAMHFKMKPI